MAEPGGGDAGERRPGDEPPAELRRGIEVSCDACGRAFLAPRSLAGGLTTCPMCRTVVQVRDGATTRIGRVVYVIVMLSLCLLLLAIAVRVAEEQGWKVSLVVAGAAVAVFYFTFRGGI